ncbi:response regulator [Nocardioides sp.]|uniref:response regulator n=1 Tax=Nocardioides sp. TaxID=35761 RepID=UPI00286B406F|nr:response regulator [Nocardioides sp.]
MRDASLQCSIVEHSPDGLWILDGEGRTLFGNARLAEILGRPEQELVGLLCADVLDAVGRVQLEAHLEEMRAGHPGQQNLDALLLRPDGSPVWVLLSWTPLPDPDGVVRGWLHRVSEYTQRKLLLDTLQDREHQLAAAQSLAHLGSWEWTVETDTIWWSDELYRIYGLDPDEFDATYEAFLSFLHPHDRPRVEEAIRDCFAAGEDFSWEGRIVRGDGEIRWLRGLGIVHRNAAGVPLRMSGTAQDISSLMRADQLAAEATRRLHLLQQMAESANRSSNLSSALANAARAIAANTSWDFGFALVRDEATGALVPLDLHDDLVPGVEQPDHALAERCWTSLGVELAPAPGRDATHSLVGVPLVVNGETVCVVGLVADEVPPDVGSQELIRQIVDQLSRVAERERNAEELASARDAAMEASRLKSEFLATMSHEIRTPMNGVIGLNDLLLRTELDTRQRRLAEGLRGAGLTLLGLINDILDLSKIESGKLELEAEDIDIRSAFEQTAAVLAGPAHEKGLELVVACHPDVPVLLNGDSVRLGQILTNLGSNAVKFTDVGEVAIQAVVAGQDDDGLVLRVEVRDTGLGISETQRVGLFDAFTQADRSTTRQHGGTGLGLAISQQLVHAMGGEIGLESTPGEGSTFWFTARLGHARSDRPEQVSASTYPMRGRRILVVDDNTTSRTVLREQLVAWQASVVAVATAEDAVAQTLAAAGAGVPFDVVLLDLTLDAVDGLALAARLRASLDRPPPLLLLTRDQPVSESQARAAGITATVTKPVKLSDLYDALLLAVVGEAPARARSPRRTRSTPPLGVSVLVVEDNAVNQLVATGLLESLGCRVEVAGNGVEAVDRLAGDHGFDVVLMDCRMPLLDGYDATRAIRAREDDVRVPIIAMTASALEGERERCLAAGMDDFLTKPVDPPQLARAIFRWVPAARSSTSVAESDTSPVLDPVLDLERVAMLSDLVKDGVSFFERTRMSFLARIDLTLAEIRTAVADEHAEGAMAAAHQLKGSALNLGLTQVGAAAAAVEAYAETGSVEGIGSLVDGLAQAVVTGVDALVRVSS